MQGKSTKFSILFFPSSIKVRIFIVCLLAIKSRTTKFIFEQQEEIKKRGVQGKFL